MILLAPSILSADFSRLREAIQQVENAGADWLHCDIMDGHFVPNLTFGPLVVAAARRCSSLPLDVHLMIAHPEKYLTAFREAGADRLTVHVETCPHLHRVVQQIRQTGAAAGVALNPATPLTLVEEILGDIDLLLVMTVNPGFGGQAFLHSTLPKLQRAHEMIRSTGRTILLEADGGIDVETVAATVRAGADVLVAGAAIFGATDPAAACAQLKHAALAARPDTVHP
ncbi:MAG: ribulose-phosphate 3-epimerase [candidate division KSB1 bacterium]|nr:ribulose-phosphate 3-epimerase [candidate division KSB1 bacterium]MDZ7273018.1 ribulose-phosphate 3-epimerase [candidate division KSB1 bacterium]MDZ7285121.1 ribulose-phosphate 3-epimerase [candidate division KSB1 bacterium]MDZ7298153.1 ribulose-phosphate 3-epimerase [candidate division KSB1 bacterium]MDZ7306907.1 ribulose-phosphate 3-epimerase [candidate division KSB1 bacterium]